MQKSRGWFLARAEGSVAQVLEARTKLLTTLSYALLSCIDSNTQLAEMPLIQQLVTHAPQDCAFLGSGLVCTVECLYDFKRRHELFNGFDEVWFFARRPEHKRPRTGYLMAPYNIVRDELSSAVADWMRDTDCYVGLGDGIGINIVSCDPSVVLQLGLAETADDG